MALPHFVPMISCGGEENSGADFDSYDFFIHILHS